MREFPAASPTSATGTSEQRLESERQVARPADSEELPDLAGSHLGRSVWRSYLALFAEHRRAMVGVYAIVFIGLFCFVGPLLHHTSQVASNIANADLAPSMKHLLGTDDSGYDELGRLMIAGRTSLAIAFGAAALGTLLGVVWGATAAFAGRAAGAIMMRIVDGALAIPGLLLLVVLCTIISPTVPILILIVAAQAWLVPARLIRAESLSLRTRDFVDAARGMGGGRFWIIKRHIVPNAVGTILVNMTFQIADAIIIIAYLSFLGFGIPPPATNWGAMLSSGLNFAITGYWWLIYPPGIAIVLTVIAFNFIADGLRETFDVRLRLR